MLAILLMMNLLLSVIIGLFQYIFLRESKDWQVDPHPLIAFLVATLMQLPTLYGIIVICHKLYTNT